MGRGKEFAAGLVVVVVAMRFSLAQNPGPQPRPAPSVEICLYNVDATTTNCEPGQTTTFVEPGGPPVYPPGKSNLLKTVFTNNTTDLGFEVLNTVPSTPDVPYNLIDGEVTRRPIDSTSPTDDLTALFQRILDAAQNGTLDNDDMQLAIAILEGDRLPVPRNYDGLPLLHYTAPEKVKSVTPIYGSGGKIVGGNVNVHQIWFDSHIESDTAFIDPSAVWDVPWEITYTVDVLHRGDDDFAPFVMYFSDPQAFGVFGQPLTGMDQTFFPMLEGQEYVFHIKMAQGKYLSLVYTWGWRRHPPRIQVMENSMKQIGGRNIVDWEVLTFGGCPRCSRGEQLRAIGQIGELAPEKRMWQDLLNAQRSNSPARVVQYMRDAQLSLADWQDRTNLPRGVSADADANATLFFVNNTIYGNVVTFPEWVNRPAQSSAPPNSLATTYRATLINGDHFIHSYGTVDFGGARGWENLFQSTLQDGGSGCYFTFGRDHWSVTAGVQDALGLINVPAADDSGQNPGIWHVNFILNFDPSPRLRLYQFDPMHHDVAIYSLH